MTFLLIYWIIGIITVFIAYRDYDLEDRFTIAQEIIFYAIGGFIYIPWMMKELATELLKNKEKDQD